MATPERLLRRLVSRVFVCGRRPYATSALPGVTSECPARREEKVGGGVSEVKSFRDIPSPAGLPLVGTTLNLIASGGAAKVYKYCDLLHSRLGPIYREKIGPVEAVFISEPKLMQQVYSHEGKYPRHMVPEPWIIYNKITNTERGLFFMNGTEWNSTRKIINSMLKEKRVFDNTDLLNEVITDLLNRWRTLKDDSGALPDLETELYSWSVESVGMMMFGKRMGCVQAGNNPGTMHDFVRYVKEIFMQTAKMTIVPPQLAHKLRLPVWKRFCAAVENTLSLAKAYVQRTTLEIQEKAASGLPVRGVLHELLQDSDEPIDEEKLVLLVTDLFIAAADTTTHTTQWILYLLAKHPHCQDILRKELEKLDSLEGKLEMNYMSKCPYLKGIIKESLRLYPVAPFLTRILDHDLIIDGYTIPAQTLILMSLYTAGRDVNYHKCPDKFLPERWVNSKTTAVNNIHSCLPFGLGVRSCVGRRLAETQIQLLVSRLIQQFEVEVINERPIEADMRMVTVPDRPIKLRLTPRRM